MSVADIVRNNINEWKRDRKASKQPTILYNRALDSSSRMLRFFVLYNYYLLEESDRLIKDQREEMERQGFRVGEDMFGKILSGKIKSVGLVWMQAIADYWGLHIFDMVRRGESLSLEDWKPKNNRKNVILAARRNGVKPLS